METKLKVMIDAIHNTKGEGVLIYDFTQVNPFIDRVVICSADNLRQTYAIASNVKDKLKEEGFEIPHIEGNKDSKWILIDADEIIVHIFQEEERKVYQLESLYADLPRIEEK